MDWKMVVASLRAEAKNDMARATNAANIDRDSSAALMYRVGALVSYRVAAAFEAGDISDKTATTAKTSTKPLKPAKPSAASKEFMGQGWGKAARRKRKSTLNGAKS